jgi:hypothetical protein
VIDKDDWPEIDFDGAVFSWVPHTGDYIVVTAHMPAALISRQELERQASATGRKWKSCRFRFFFSASQSG